MTASRTRPNRTLTFTLLVISMLLGALTFDVGPAFACDCTDYGPLLPITRMEAAFIGTPVERIAELSSDEIRRNRAG